MQSETQFILESKMKNSAIIKFFWQHIRPYKWLYLIMLAAPIITSFYPFLYNYAIKLFLDTMNTHANNLTYHAVLFPLILFIGTQIVFDTLWRISEIAEWNAEPYVRRSIILQSYGYIQNHSYTFFQDNLTGALSSKIKGALDGYDKFWEEMHHGLMHKVFRIAVNLVALLFVNLYLGLFVVLWFAIYFPIMYRLSLKLHSLSYAVSESRHTIIGLISDKISNIFSIKAFASGKREAKVLEDIINTDFIPKQIKMYKRGFSIQLISAGMYAIFFAFMIIFMIHLKIQNLVTLGDFAFVFGLCLVTTDDIWHTTASLQDFSMAMGDLKSCLEPLYIPQQNLDLPEAKQLVIKSPIIEFKNTSFGYESNNLIFKNLNLTIKAGEKVGLVGHSGAGKSTLINLLLKYFALTNGAICIDHQDIKNVMQDSVRENIAVIPQDIMLFHRTIMENIRFGNQDATDAQVIEACKQAHIHQFITSLPDGYNAFVGERGVKLSGGQRQRIAIARAILKDAPILILDEATSSLDSQTEQLIQESLNIFIDDKAKTVIAIAHRLSTLKHMDRIIVLDRGAIVEEGTHEQLIGKQDSLYGKLWKYQEI
jgi:ATP-binding cassette subfamily B protein